MVNFTPTDYLDIEDAVGKLNVGTGPPVIFDQAAIHQLFMIPADGDKVKRNHPVSAVALNSNSHYRRETSVYTRGNQFGVFHEKYGNEKNFTTNQKERAKTTTSKQGRPPASNLMPRGRAISVQLSRGAPEADPTANSDDAFVAEDPPEVTMTAIMSKTDISGKQSNELGTIQLTPHNIFMLLAFCLHNNFLHQFQITPALAQTIFKPEPDGSNPTFTMANTRLASTGPIVTSSENHLSGSRLNAILETENIISNPALTATDTNQIANTLQKVGKMYSTYITQNRQAFYTGQLNPHANPDLERALTDQSAETLNTAVTAFANALASKPPQLLAALKPACMQTNAEKKALKKLGWSGKGTPPSDTSEPEGTTRSESATKEALDLVATIPGKIMNIAKSDYPGHPAALEKPKKKKKTPATPKPKSTPGTATPAPKKKPPTRDSPNRNTGYKGGRGGGGYRGGYQGYRGGYQGNRGRGRDDGRGRGRGDGRGRGRGGQRNNDWNQRDQRDRARSRERYDNRENRDNRDRDNRNRRENQGQNRQARDERPSSEQRQHDHRDNRREEQNTRQQPASVPPRQAYVPAIDLSARVPTPLTQDQLQLRALQAQVAAMQAATLLNTQQQQSFFPPQGNFNPATPLDTQQFVNPALFNPNLTQGQGLNTAMQQPTVTNTTSYSATAQGNGGSLSQNNPYFIQTTNRLTGDLRNQVEQPTKKATTQGGATADHVPDLGHQEETNKNPAPNNEFPTYLQ